jgi:hypothetical protein
MPTTRSGLTELRRNMDIEAAMIIRIVANKANPNTTLIVFIVVLSC